MTAAISMPAEVAGWDANPCELAPVAASCIANIRTELLETFLEQMNTARLPYCLLNNFQGYPELITSDVDFMVRPEDAGRIAELLLEVARRRGARLVQAIRHETGAWYFVLAKQVGDSVAYLHPDCSTDYRRDGRLWLEAEPVIKRRRNYKTFFVLATADEFLYCLTKKILKQRISSAQWRRIVALYLSCPEDCSERLLGFWLEETARALVMALARQDIGWMRSSLPALLSELNKSAPVESLRGRVQQRFSEWRRWLERAMNPTGLSISICGGKEQMRTDLAKALEGNLRPAFRRSMICEEKTAGDNLCNPVRLRLAKVQSTLVIRKREVPDSGWLTRDEITFVLPDWQGRKVLSARIGGGSRQTWEVLDDRRLLEQNVNQATQVTLEYLGARLQRRMKLKGALSVPPQGAE